MERPATKDIWFARELIAASGVTTLEEALPLWELSHVDVVGGDAWRSCDLCHTRLKRFAVIRNIVTEIRKAIGFDCYAKLLHFLDENYLAHARIRSIDEHERSVREYARRHIDAAMLAWMRKQDLPTELRRSIEVIDVLGYPPSRAATEVLVDYYRHRRFFSLTHTQFVSQEIRALLERFPHAGLFPRRVNFAGLARIEYMLKEWRDRKSRRIAEQERAAVLDVIAPEPDGRVITPFVFVLEGEPHQVFGPWFPAAHIAVIINYQRYECTVRLWEERNPLEQFFGDEFSREFLTAEWRLYHQAFGATRPESFRVVRNGPGEICMAAADLKEWLESAHEWCVQEIAREMRKREHFDKRLRERGDKSFGQFQAVLREQGWMSIPHVGALCGVHWEICGAFLEQRYNADLAQYMLERALPTESEHIARGYAGSSAWGLHCCWYEVVPEERCCGQVLRVPMLVPQRV